MVEKEPAQTAPPDSGPIIEAVGAAAAAAIPAEQTPTADNPPPQRYQPIIPWNNKGMHHVPLIHGPE